MATILLVSSGVERYFDLRSHVDYRERKQSTAPVRSEDVVESEDAGERKTRYGPDGDYSHISIGTQPELMHLSLIRMTQQGRAPRNPLESMQNRLVWRWRLT
jgi:hypothetical protein